MAIFNFLNKKRIFRFLYNLRLQDQGKDVAAIPYFAICGYMIVAKV